LPPTGEAVAPAAAPESSPAAIEEAEHRHQDLPPQHPEPAHKTPAITDAIEQVNRIIEELKHSLDEMEEVLETLELAERQKIDDEREIQNLQRALRQMHRPRDSEPRH
jgi:predicted RNase H-like nuclease (RuvC/YqgF family)